MHQCSSSFMQLSARGATIVVCERKIFHHLIAATITSTTCISILDPVLNAPTDVKSRTFLPDPTDGSLYMYSAAHNGLKKMPFSIPQLVSASPCKSNEEGILYTGACLSALLIGQLYQLVCVSVFHWSSTQLVLPTFITDMQI